MFFDLIKQTLQDLGASYLGSTLFQFISLDLVVIVSNTELNIYKVDEYNRPLKTLDFHNYSNIMEGCIDSDRLMADIKMSLMAPRIKQMERDFI